MTQVIKTIKGHRYYYFQDAVKIDGKNRVISTCIGRVDLPSTDLINAQDVAYGKHLINLLKTESIIKRPEYRFENVETDGTLEDTLEGIKLMYDAVIRNLSPADLEEFQKTVFVKYVHGTTAIEGNTLTEEETYRVLSSGLTPQNKTINEMLEVANYNEARAFLETYRGDITEKMIKRIHLSLTKGLIDDTGRPILSGEYRTNQAILRNIAFRPAKAEMIPDKLHYLLADYYSGIRRNAHPIELASTFHQKFEEIHPFQDGNGRTGREILNFMLQRSGFPPVYIGLRQQSEYLTALQMGNQENFIPLMSFIISRIVASIQYLYARTNLYEKLVSEESIRFAEERGARQIYERFLETMKITRHSIEPP